jgi:hypothetical protein
MIADIATANMAVAKRVPKRELMPHNGLGIMQKKS